MSTIPTGSRSHFMVGARMLWIVVSLLQTFVVHPANSQQAQPFYYSNTDNRQSSRYIPFQGNEFPSAQQPFANYFPQTNAGPYLPFRTPAPNYQLDAETLASVSKFQRQPSQQFNPPAYQPPPARDSNPRYDPLISSPGTFGRSSEDYPENFQEDTRFKVNEAQQQAQYRNQLRFSQPVAISEVTRSQDNPNLIQTHSFINVHHTTRQPEPQARWLSSSPSEELRPRVQSPKPTTTTDAYVKNNRFLIKDSSYVIGNPQVSIEHPQSQSIELLAPEMDSNPRIEEPKEPKPRSRFRNISPQPTTYSPPVEQRVKNLSTTEAVQEAITTAKIQILARNSGQPARGRNKFSRPESDDKSKLNKIKRVNVTTTTTSATPKPKNENTNFDVVTMSHEHLFVSEDNFKGFVDSAVIDNTDSPLTELPKNPDTHVTFPSTTRKKALPVETSTATTSTTTTPTTEGWIIVASVQTSRSVSGARFIPSAAIKQEQHPLDKSLKEKHKDSVSSESQTKARSTTTSTSTVSTESIIDKLDQVQSELSSGILSALPSQSKQSLEVPDITSSTTMPSSTTTTTSTTASTTTTTFSSLEESSSEEETFTRKFVPAAKRTTPKPSRKSLMDSIQFDDLTEHLLPPGFKVRGFTPKSSGGKSNKTNESITSTSKTTSSTTTEKNRKETKAKSILSKYKVKFDDVSALLPPDYKPPAEPSEPSTESVTLVPAILSKAKPVDVSAFLPPGFKLDDEMSSSTEPSTTKLPSILSKIQFKETNELIPSNFTTTTNPLRSTEVVSSTTELSTSTKSGNSTKVVFPSRPGGAKKQSSNLPKTGAAKPSVPSHQVPVIQKGWPTRPTTEFTGWVTPSPSPISVEKLLQAAKEASARESAAELETTSTTTTTTTSTTTTRRTTTPGICTEFCDLAGSIKLVTGVKWMPELLDHNTKEWRTLANDVQHQLELTFQISEALSRWYRRITIDAFRPGSVYVDYVVELSDLGKTVNTADMRRLFHDTLLQETITSDTFKTTNVSSIRQLKMGKFMVDPEFTEFEVLPRLMIPTAGMAEQDMWLPQWAIAVIVIGLASLLFVLIFGITVLISRHKHSKKHPTTLTEEMLNELNKSHMGGGFDNYGADDLYNMEDVWNEKPSFSKKRSSYYQDGSMPNIYDSWRSDWHGYYGNSHYNESVRSGYSRRRSDYDTNF